jgi:predicted PurR-regulated permease PerM
MEQAVNPRLVKFTIGLFLFCLVIFILMIAKDFLTPIAWALMISLASLRFLERIHKKTRIRWGLLILIHLSVLLLLTFGVLTFLFTEVRLIILNSPELDSKIAMIDQNLVAWLSRMGVDTTELFNLKTLSQRLSDFSQFLFQVVGNVGHVFGDMVLTLIYSFFILFYKDVMGQFIHMRHQDEQKLKRIQGFADNSLSIISDYLGGTLIMTVLMGILIYIFLLLLGIKYAIFWAAFAAILNLIPYIGNAIALVALAGYAFLTKDSLWYPVLAIGALFLANAVQENILRPLIVGDRLSLNALTVFISVIVGGIIWGVSGMILFIPIAGIIKIILESKDSTRPYALFFGELGLQIEELEPVDQLNTPRTG